jgi:murein L,D-transpeptidase YcbB/YkuD
LPRPVPVYLTYLTVNPREKGVAFLDDIYGRDGDGRAQRIARRD